MISVVITAWNEEKNLPRVVRSVSALAGEVIVVDTESTDRTVEVAKSLGCKVYHHKNTSIVEPVRNFSISKATGDWILLLDADEEVSQTLARLIQSVITSGSVDYARIPRQNLIFGRWIRSSHWWPDYVYRLFKKGQITWKNEIHSIPLTRGTGFDFPASASTSIVHHHYESISQYILRLNRYTDIQVAEILATNYKFTWSDLLTKPSSEFITQYFARKGFSEGLHGLALALLQTFSSLILYLKLWQSLGFTPNKLDPSDLNQQLITINQQLIWWHYQSKIKSASSITQVFWKLVRKVHLFTRL